MNNTRLKALRLAAERGNFSQQELERLKVTSKNMKEMIKAVQINSLHSVPDGHLVQIYKNRPNLRNGINRNARLKSRLNRTMPIVNAFNNIVRAHNHHQRNAKLNALHRTFGLMGIHGPYTANHYTRLRQKYRNLGIQGPYDMYGLLFGIEPAAHNQQLAHWLANL